MNMLGKKNIYTCKYCGHFVVTIDVDEGITPMIIKCQNTINDGREICNGQMFSAFYNIPQVYQSMPPKMEWYKPDAEEIKKLKGAHVKEHVKNGGLLLREFQAKP